MCRCRACNANLSSRELTRKYSNLPPDTPPEEQYIGLCNSCFTQSDITVAISNPTLTDNDGELVYGLSEAKSTSFNVFEQDEQGISEVVLLDKDYTM